MVWQRHIKTALFFAKRKIAVTVDGESKDVRIVLENFGCAVALVHVKIDHSGSADEISFSQELDGNRNVIKDAETSAFSAKSMVRAAAEGGSPAMFHGLQGSGDCSAYGRIGALDKSF